jgi:hypothetical protein
LIHTPRTRWLRPGSPSQEASERDRSASSDVRRDRFGTGFSKAAQRFNAGWSSPVARQAHNLKVIGSNPIPATKLIKNPSNLKRIAGIVFGDSAGWQRIGGARQDEARLRGLTQRATDVWLHRRCAVSATLHILAGIRPSAGDLTGQVRLDFQNMCPTSRRVQPVSCRA